MWSGGALLALALGMLSIWLIVREKAHPIEGASHPDSSENVLGRRVVTGRVDLVSCDMDTWLGTRRDNQGFMIVTLTTERGITVVCQFAPGAGPSMALEQGDEVTIRGTFDGETPYTLNLSASEVVSFRSARR